MRPIRPLLEGSKMTCQRCGQCCMKCGSTFWVHGNLSVHLPFGNHALLNKLADGREPLDDGLPCEMLTVIGHKTFCAIERYAGKEFKPKVCREFPTVNDDCFFPKKDLTGDLVWVES